jgi:hypothetical protein
MIEKADSISKSFGTMVTDNKTALSDNRDAISNTLKENRDELAKALGQNRESLKASVDQGKAALDASINMSQANLRAWVGVVGVNTVGGVADAESFGIQSVHIIIRNSGKTPALKMSGNCCELVNRSWRDPIPDYDAVIKEDEETRKKLLAEQRKRTDDMIRQHPELASIIAERDKEFEALSSSAEKKFLHEGAVLPPDVPQDFSILSVSVKWGAVRKHEFSPGGPSINEPMTIYLLGKITYSDVFVGTPQHSTKFSLMRTTGTSFGICPEGNWMD